VKTVKLAVRAGIGFDLLVCLVIVSEVEAAEGRSDREARTKAISVLFQA
jgi:hypothetical protein